MNTWPLYKVLMASFWSYILIALIHARFFYNDIFCTAFFFAGYYILGAIYTNLFEYFWHRVAMHIGIPRLGVIKLSQLDHHRIFHGKDFRSRYGPYLEHISGVWYSFPILLSLHYLVALLILDHSAVLPFLMGSTNHYQMYETIHWYTHVDNNNFDKVIFHVPILRSIRKWEIKNHGEHHEKPDGRFNVTYPLGDWIAALVKWIISKYKRMMGLRSR